MEAQLRKAAVVVASLEKAQAAQVLARIPDVLAQRLRNAVNALDAISPKDSDDIIREFLQDHGPSSNAGGVEFDVQLAARFETPNEYTSPPASDPFEFLLHTEPDVVLPFLQREHLQTVAVVLSFLPKRQSAALLCRLDERRRGEVLARIARLNGMDDATVNVVADELRDWIQQQQSKARHPREGDQIAASIADAAPASQRDHLKVALRKGQNDCSMDGESESPVRLDEPPPSPSVEFSQIVLFSDERLLAVMQQTPPDTLRLALSGADESLLSRVTSQLPRRAAKRFRKSLTLNSPTRLADIDAAQTRVAEIAGRVVASSTSHMNSSR